MDGRRVGWGLVDKWGELGGGLDEDAMSRVGLKHTMYVVSCYQQSAYICIVFLLYFSNTRILVIITYY